MSLVLLAVVVVVGAIVGVSMFRDRSQPGAPPVQAGDFTVETNLRRISAGGFPNTSGNPFATRPSVDYTIRHRGQVVEIALAGGESTNAFWDARVLADAPTPTVLVANLGAWLLTEDKGGKLVVTTLAEPSSDFSTLQWLDADDGQPGEEITVAMLEEPTEPRVLTGGKYLLVNRRNVLEVATGTPHPYSPDPMAHDLQGFYPSGEKARMLSPDGRQVVFAASRNAGDDYGFDYALVAVDWSTSRAYAVPFPRTPTRFDSVWDIDRAWLAHYFDWQPGDDGLRLRYRDEVEPRPWRGRVARMHGGMVEYAVKPVSRDMLSALVEFVERTEGATRGDSADADRVVLTFDDATLNAWWQAEEQSLSLYAEPGPQAPAGYARIERIAAAFDAELATRRHDALFGSLEGAR